MGVVDDDQRVIRLCQKGIQRGVDQGGGLADFGDPNQRTECTEWHLGLRAGADHPHRVALAQSASDLGGQRRLSHAIDAEYGDAAGVAFVE